MATSIAVIAVASIGLLMLSGRVRMRRGATVILGCFILFGVATIAQGFRAAATSLSYSTAPADPDPIGSDARRAFSRLLPQRRQRTRMRARPFGVDRAQDQLARL